MKRRLWIAAAMLIILAMVSACGGKSGSSSSGEPSNSASPSQSASKNESSAPAKEPVTLTLNGWLNGKGEEDLKKIIANFEAANPDIKVQYVPLVTNGNSTDYLKKLDIMMSAGEETDVVAFPNVDFLIERAARGVLAPLNDFHKANNVVPADEYYIDPVYNGQSYGIQDLASLWLVAINENALKEANLPIPDWGWTWDDFRDYAKKLTKGSGETKQYGAYFHTWGEYANFIAYSERPHPYLNADKKPNFMDASFTQFFNLRRAMEKDDKSVAALSDIIGAKLHYRTEFVNKKAAMVPTATFFISQLLDRANNPHDFKTVFAPLPRSSKDADIGLSYLGGNFNAISATSKHKEEAYKFIRYISTQMDVIRDMPGWKKADPAKVISALVGDANKDLIDVDSLQKTMFDSRIKTIYDGNLSTATSSQMKKVLEDGFTEFMLNDLKAEDEQAKMVDAANKLSAQ